MFFKTRKAIELSLVQTLSLLLDGKQFGKAKTREEAIRMLKELQGKMHSIYTSLAILIENQGKYKEYKELNEVKVFIRNMSDEEIAHYVDSEQPFYCAGAYAIQGFFSVFVDKIEGNYRSCFRTSHQSCL